MGNWLTSNSEWLDTIKMLYPDLEARMRYLEHLKEAWSYNKYAVKKYQSLIDDLAYDILEKEMLTDEPESSEQSDQETIS